MKWKKLDIRPLTKEEKEYYKDESFTFMYEGETPETPELFEECLVYQKGGNVRLDTWTEFDIGVGFEDTDAPCWWMPLPEPPKGEKNNERL